MKRPLLGVILAVCVLVQPAGHARQMPSPDDVVARMQAQLNLTNQQVTAVKPVIEDYMAKRRQAIQNMRQTGDRDGMRTQMRRLRAEELQQLSQILTADQMARWKSMHGGRHHGYHRRNGTSD